MHFFYIRHHFLSIVRSKSVGGEVFALAMLGFFLLASAAVTMESMETYVLDVSSFFGRSGADYALFLMCYLLLDLSVRLVFRRPLPKLKYYALWDERSSAIASQYLFTSLFGIVPFLLFSSFLMVAATAREWMGNSVFAVLMLFWLANHCLALVAQFSPRWVPRSFLILILLIFILSYWIPGASVEWLFSNLFFGGLLLLVIGFLAFHRVRRAISERKAYHIQGGRSWMDRLPVIHFQNPIFQLEWALLVRNKRTRSNLLMGLVSVLILPFLMSGDEPAFLSTVIYFITTGFFILQHGVYSLGWEGSYYDFLVSNIKPLQFVRTRFAFYALTCLVGLLLGSVSTVILGLNWLNIFAVFLYNVGITIPLVLYRSTLNETRIVLTENSFMNYNGMMTAPIFVTSFLVIMLPLIVLGAAQTFLAENALLMLGAFGVLGLGFYKPVTQQLARRYQHRKYHLSQSFKS